MSESLFDESLLDILVEQINPSHDPFVGFHGNTSMQPHDQTADVPEQDHHIPEPDEREYLLVEEIYWQDTLDCVFMTLIRISNFSDHKIAQCYLYKIQK